MGSDAHRSVGLGIFESWYFTVSTFQSWIWSSDQRSAATPAQLQVVFVVHGYLGRLRKLQFMFLWPRTYCNHGWVKLDLTLFERMFEFIFLLASIAVPVVSKYALEALNRWGNKFESLHWCKEKFLFIRNGVRNSLLIAPMPTASTAQILGNNESIEPYTSNIYTRRVLSGEFQVTS